MSSTAIGGLFGPGEPTTTAMTTEALVAAGLSPTGLAGGRVAAWQGNLRLGDNKVFVAEADEYDRSFLALKPTVATVTNVESDHLDIYAQSPVAAYRQDSQSLRVREVETQSSVVEGRDDRGLPVRAELKFYFFRVEAQKRADPVQRLWRLFVVRLDPERACVIGRVTTQEAARRLADGRLACSNAP